MHYHRTPLGIPHFALQLYSPPKGQKVVPPAYVQAFVCLVPKETVIHVPKQYRSLCLIESVNKLLTGLVYQRVLPHWPLLKCRLGALPSSQCVECLWLAHTLLYKEFRTGTGSLWVLLDARAASDTLHREAILRLLLRRTPQALHHQCLILWELLQCEQVTPGVWTAHVASNKEPHPVQGFSLSYLATCCRCFVMIGPTRALNISMYFLTVLLVMVGSSSTCKTGARWIVV